MTPGSAHLATAPEGVVHAGGVTASIAVVHLEVPVLVTHAHVAVTCMLHGAHPLLPDMVAVLEAVEPQ